MLINCIFAPLMDKQEIKRLKELLESPKNIVIVGHKNPDGDAVGSCNGLSFFLNGKGHNAEVIMPNDFPEFLKWLPGCEGVQIFDRNESECTLKIENADLIFTLDFNALNRTGSMQGALESTSAEFVLIDHHQQPDDFARFVYSDVKMGSTSQMVYHFIDMLGEIESISPEIATNLYTGIMTDSGGSFKFASTTSTTHRVVADLIDRGANNSKIHENVYDTNSHNRLKLLGVALNNLVLLPEYKTAYISLSQQDLDEHGFKKGDTEGFVNYALSIKDTVLAVIFIENKGEGITKMSFRSKGEFSVNELAREYFSGGGHTNAAGGRSSLTLKDTITEFISILPRYRDALNHVS